MKKIMLLGALSKEIDSFRKVLNELFSDFELLQVESGEEGIKLIDNCTPDIIFIFEKLQDMDRLDVCYILKENKLTGSAIVFASKKLLTKNYRNDAIEKGVDAFLRLPVDIPEFRLFVNTMIKVKIANEVSSTSGQEQQSKEVSEQNELFRNLFKYHKAIKLIIDPNDGQIIDANLAAEDFYGWTKEQLKQMKIKDINTKPEEIISKELEKARTNKQNYFEFRHRLADGSLRDVEVFSSQIEVKGKTLLHSIIHDITARKQVETKLKTSEEKLKLINELTSEMLELPDVKGIYTYIVNKLHQRLPDTIVLFNSIDENAKQSRVERIVGIENKLLSRIMELTGFDPRDKVYKLSSLHDSYFQLGKLVEFNGGLTEFSDSAITPLLAQTISKIIGLHKIYTIGLKKDKKLLSSIHFFTFNKMEIEETSFIETLVNQAGIILQKKLAEQDLKVSEEKYRQLAENMKDIVWVFDTQTMRFNYISPSVKSLRGYAPEEIIGEPLKESLSPKYYDSVLKEIDEQKANFISGKITSNDYFIREIEQPCKDGSVVRTEVNLHLWRNPYTQNIELHGVTRDITARKKAEQALQESEKRLKRAELASKSGNWELHLDSNIIIASDGARTIYELDTNFVDYLSIKTLPLNEYRIKLDNAMKQLIEEDIPYDIEFKIKAPATGSIKDIHSHAIYDKNKKIVFGIIQDITERKRSEEAIKESENKFRSLFSEMSEGFALHEIVYDSNRKAIDYRILNVNSAFEKLIGIKAENAIGVLSTKLYNIEEAPYLNIYSQVAQTGEHQSFQVYFPPFDRYFQISAFSPNPGFFATIFTDITEQKLSRMALEESERRFRDMMEHVNMVSAMLDIHGNITFANDYLLKLTGWKQEELIGQNWFDVFIPLGAAVRSDLFRDIELGKVPVHYENEILTRSGELRLIDWSNSILRNSRGEIEGLAGIGVDITEKKNAEKALQESEASLRELNATKDKFFSIIAHDLKGPFNSIIGLSDLLEEHVQERNYTAVEEYAHIIHKSSIQAINLLTNLLEWSRSQIGRIEYSPEYVEMVNLIHEVSGLFDEQARQKSISIIINLPPNIIAFADKAMISTVLRNLISNAVKFTRPGGTITISAKSSSNKLEVSVSDNGIGILEEDLKELFLIGEIHTRYGTLNEKGTGLGLILCKEFINKHGGSLDVESRIGKGSKFTFSIPIP
mgnify:CR=1 FL=1